MEFNLAIARIVLIEVVFGLPIALYVYRDARKRGMRFPGAWAMFSGLLVLAGLVVYVLAREPVRTE